MSKELIEELRVNADAHPLDVRLSVMTEAADALESQAREIERLQLTCNDLDDQNDRIYAELAALKAQHEQDAQTIKVLQAMARQLKAQPSGVLPALTEALKFYANGHHLLLADPDAWDTCSGELINFLHDDAGTASVEDGSIAKAALDSLNSYPVSAGDDLTASECACGDQYPANSYGAGFMAANNGVCENCDASAPSHGEQVRHMVAGAKPEWAKMKPEWLIDFLREETNFNADMVGDMLRFAIAAAPSPSKQGGAV